MSHSLRLRVAMAFAVLLTAALLIMNNYPQQLVRDQMIAAAQEELLGRASTLASALGGFPELDWDEIDSAVRLLDSARDGRVLVLDGGGLVLYDSVRTGQMFGRVLLSDAVLSALDCRDYFCCDYGPGVFSCRSSAPMLRENLIVGVVSIERSYDDNALLLSEMRGDMRQMSAAALILCVIFLLAFNTALGRRFSTLLSGVHAVGGGNYDYRIQMDGTDELQEIAEEFNELSRKLQRTERIRRQFVSDASHELKTPLASIKLLSDSIAQSPNISREEMREFVGDIGSEIGRLTRITESLLSLSRLDAQPEQTPECCQLDETVRKCRQLLEATAAQRGISFRIELDEPWLVTATNDGVYHIIFNLMENAVKYNKEGGVVTVRCVQEGDMVALSVSDTGIGIPSEELPRIYERFYRVDKARSRATGGTGLGLAIVHDTVENLGGEMRVESRLGEGTCFTVLLPAWKGERP